MSKMLTMLDLLGDLEPYFTQIVNHSVKDKHRKLASSLSGLPRISHLVLSLVKYIIISNKSIIRKECDEGCPLMLTISFRGFQGFTQHDSSTFVIEMYGDIV